MKRDENNRLTRRTCRNRKLIFQLTPLTRLGMIHDVSPSLHHLQMFHRSRTRSRPIPRYKLFSVSGTPWHPTRRLPALLHIHLDSQKSGTWSAQLKICIDHPISAYDLISLYLTSNTSAALFHIRRWRLCPLTSLLAFFQDG